MLGGFFLTKKLIPSVLGITGIFGGGGYGISKLLSSSGFIERYEILSGPSVTLEDGRRLERSPEIELEEKVVAEFVYRNEQGGEIICEQWISSGHEGRANKSKVEKEKCQSSISTALGEVNLERPIKWLWSEEQYLANILKNNFVSSSGEESSDIKQALPEKENQWTFGNEWLCTNLFDSQRKDVISCEKIGKDSLRERGFKVSD
ncbi:hypothetical protein [Mycoplasma suis]|uniref:Uncharacterized protein n=1 Tax=Mycoplasma suis (strain Illinois) TaxID=768700 RepID=F0QQI4_MYCSL|nr:hypothetical protein [Mycoplasma suis]ADX97754.1 hypothetical protein MSU_0210 [Mycoplasma suis str. Illinois]